MSCDMSFRSEGSPSSEGDGWTEDDDCCVVEDVEVTDAKLSAAGGKPSAAPAPGSGEDVWKKNCWCQICGEVFATDSVMLLHLREKHGADDKCYKCGLCCKSFPSSQQLTQHMLVHTNVRRYQCQFCDKAFKQLSHVQQHERIHTGELPYHCPVSSCERSFRQLSSMKQHLKGHGQSSTPPVNSSVSSSSASSSSASLSSTSSSSAASSETVLCSSLSPKVTTEIVLGNRSPHLVMSPRYPEPDSSSGLVLLTRQVAVARSSADSDNSVESSKDEEPLPAKEWRAKTGSMVPLYQQSLIDLSSKLGEIKRRQKRLRMSASQHFPPRIHRGK